MRTYLNFIGGEWVAARTGQTYQNLNPADTRETVASYPTSGKEDAQAAIIAAQKAFPAWSAMTPVARGRILSKASQILEARKPELAEALTREEGKTLAESSGEVQRAIDIFRFFGGLSYTLGGQTIPHELPNNLLYTIRQPLGVVGLITPWNFPIAIPAWKMAPALVSGNAVVIKPASQAPGPTLELAKALAEAGLPKGVLNVVIGEGRAVGGELAANPVVVALSFTGSYSVGSQIYLQLAPRMARAQMEMGGKNPTIVLADADLDSAASILVNGAFFSTGQKCTACSRAIIERPIYAALVDKLLARTRALKVGNGMEPGIDIGPAVDDAQLQTNLSYIDVARNEGARLLCGGNRLTGAHYDKGYFVEPTIFGDVTPDMRIAQEEVFGPVLALLVADDFDDAIRLANGVKFGLSASIVSNNLSRVHQFIQRIEAGLITVNLPTAGVEYQLPFGGTKASSFGMREQGQLALDFYTETRTVYLKHTA